VQKPLIDSATLLVGDTGSGKTAQIAAFAEWLWKKYQKVTLVASSDTGGVGQRLQALAKVGIARIYLMRNRIEPPETFHLITQGWWPEEVDPVTGVASETVRLIPPELKLYKLVCGQGHVVDQGPDPDKLQGKICPGCKSLVTAQTPGARKIVETSVMPGFEEAGGWACDGITSMQSLLLVYQGQAGITEAGGVSRSRAIRSGSITFGQNDKPHYGFAQNRALDWIGNSLKIPYLYAPPLFTALPYIGDDSKDGIRKAGPKLAGKAGSFEFPNCIGNCIGTQVVSTKDGPEYRLNVVQYADETGTINLCKHRGASFGALKDIAPEGYLADKVGEPEYSTCNLGVLYDHLNAALEKEIARAKTLGGPGLSAGRVGTGEPLPKSQEVPSVGQTKPQANGNGGGAGLRPGLPPPPQKQATSDQGTPRVAVLPPKGIPRPPQVKMQK
jgi:hypothetical protein